MDESEEQRWNKSENEERALDVQCCNPTIQITRGEV